VEFAHGVGHRVGAPAHIDVLGHLDGQAVGRHVPGRQLAGDLLGQASGAELGAGDVDRHAAEVDALVHPGAHLAQRPLEGDLAQLQRQVVVVEGGHEGGGRQDALFRMVPAHQRLEAGDAVGLDVDDGLVEEVEFALDDGQAHLAQQLDALLDLGPHGRLEHDAAIAAPELGLIERDVGVLEQVQRVGVRVGMERRAQAGADREALAGMGDRALEQAARISMGRNRSSAPFRPRSTTANSSPPSRATVSPRRKVWASFSARLLSKASPASWPRVSLMSLK
jgi:hypothetical protein